MVKVIIRSCGRLVLTTNDRYALVPVLTSSALTITLTLTHTFATHHLKTTLSSLSSHNPADRGCFDICQCELSTLAATSQVLHLLERWKARPILSMFSRGVTKTPSMRRGKILYVMLLDRLVLSLTARFAAPSDDVHAYHCRLHLRIHR